MIMATTNDESRLLALPMELLQRITNSLNNESLPTLRLTCKTLENATLDHFVAAFLEKRCYFVHDETRWVLLKNLLSTRLASKMREITFSYSSLERKSPTEIQLAPEEALVSMAAAQSLAWRLHVQPSEEDLRNETRPSTPLIHRVMVDIKKFAPNARVHLRLMEGSRHDHSDQVCTDMIVASTIATLPLTTLNFSEHHTPVLRQLVDYLGPDLTASFCSLVHFRYDMSFDSVPAARFGDMSERVTSADALRRVVSSMSSLRELSLNLIHDWEDWSLAPTKALFTSSFTRLQKLSLSEMVCEEKDLIVALSGSQPSLVWIQLAGIQLVAPKQGGTKEADTTWLGTLELISSMPALCDAFLGGLYVGDPGTMKAVMFGAFSVPNTSGIIVHMNGREEVVAGFQNILSSSLLYSKCRP